MTNTQNQKAFESAVFAYIFKKNILNALNKNDYSKIAEADVIDACIKGYKAYVRNVNKTDEEQRILVGITIRCLCRLVELKCEKETHYNYIRRFVYGAIEQLMRENNDDVALLFYNPIT